MKKVLLVLLLIIIIGSCCKSSNYLVRYVDLKNPSDTLTSNVVSKELFGEHDTDLSVIAKNEGSIEYPCFVYTLYSRSYGYVYIYSSLTPIIVIDFKYLEENVGSKR